MTEFYLWGFGVSSKFWIFYLVEIDYIPIFLLLLFLLLSRGLPSRMHIKLPWGDLSMAGGGLAEGNSINNGQSWSGCSLDASRSKQRLVDLSTSASNPFVAQPEFPQPRHMACPTHLEAICLGDLDAKAPKRGTSAVERVAQRRVSVRSPPLQLQLFLEARPAPWLIPSSSIFSHDTGAAYAFLHQLLCVKIPGQKLDGSALQFQVEPQVAAVARDTNILAILVWNVSSSMNMEQNARSVSRGQGLPLHDKINTTTWCKLKRYFFMHQWHVWCILVSTTPQVL